MQPQSLLNHVLNFIVDLCEVEFHGKIDRDFFVARVRLEFVNFSFFEQYVACLINKVRVES